LNNSHRQLSELAGAAAGLLTRLGAAGTRIGTAARRVKVPVMRKIGRTGRKIARNPWAQAVGADIGLRVGSGAVGAVKNTASGAASAVTGRGRRSRRHARGQYVGEQNNIIEVATMSGKAVKTWDDKRKPARPAGVQSTVPTLKKQGSKVANAKGEG